MAYLLILPICLYSALAAFVLSRRPRTISNGLVAAYTLNAVLATGAYLVQGTTPDRHVAEIASLVVALASGLEYLALPPLILLSLYFETWFRAHQRLVLVGGLTSVLLAVAAYHVLLRPDDVPLVYPVTRHAWIHWSVGLAASNWRVAAGLVLGSQTLVVAAIAYTLARRRIQLRIAVWLSLISLSSILISILSPLAGADAFVTAAGLKYLPPVLLISVLFIRASREVTLDALIRTTLRAYNDGMIILDGKRQVIWRNEQASRWLASRAVGGLVHPHIYEMLHGTSLLPTIQNMLESERTSGECEVTRDGEEFVLRVELQPLSNIRHLPGAALMILRDVTAARVRRDLHERSRELLALSAISADIASTLELDQVIARAVQQVYNLTHAGASMVYLVDERDPSVLHQADKLISEEGIIAPSNRFTIDFDVRRGPVSHVAQTRQTLIVSDANLEPYGPWLKDYGLQAGTLIPLIAREQMIGLLLVAYSAPHAFAPIEIALLESVARQLAVAIDNARLHDQERRQRRIAEVLREAASALGTKRQAEGLQALLALLGEILEYDRASVLLVAEPGKLRVGALAGFEQLEDADAITAFVMDIEDYPYLKRLFEDRTPQLVSDTTTDSVWKPGPYGYNSWIGAPLIVYDQVLGCLSLSHRQPGHFTEDDVRIASAFAAQTAIAAENTRLFDAISRQNRALSALNTVLAASNEALIHEDLPLVLLERVLEALGLSEGVIHYYDDVTNELHLRAVAGLPDAVTDRLHRLPVFTPLSGVVLPAVAAEQVYEFFSAPLISHGVGIGLLSIRQKTDSPISDDLKQLLINIGQQVGVVMDNAALFEDTSRRAALSTDLGRLSLAIGAQLDRGSVLDLLCQESIGIFDVQGAYVWRIENDRLVGEVARGAGAEQFIGHVIDLADTTLLPARVIQEWRPRYINYAADSPALPADLVALTQAQSVLAVPLLKAHVPIGTLMLVSTENPGAFADWLADQVGLLGVQAALTIQNATLFDEVRRRLDQLRLVNETGRYATAILDPQDLIDGVAHKLSVTLGYDIVSLVQIEAAQPSIRSLLVHDQPREVDSMGHLHGPLKQIASQAIERAEPVSSNQLSDAGQQEQDHEPMGEHCALAVPLIVADEVIGVLIVARHGRDSITTEDLDVLEPMAAQLAISFQNARLFETVRQQALELEARVAERTGEIRQQQERTEAILRSVADAVIVFDLMGRVVMTNPMARVLFDQHDLDMDLGTRVGDLVARVLASTPDVRDATDIIEVGPVTVQAKAARVVEGDEVLGSVVVLRDISRLQELDRMKDLFVSNVSHELRTPLANLKLYLSLLEQGRPERQALYHEVMEREIHRLTRLINDLLQISRLTSEQRDQRPRIRQPVDLEALIHTVIHDHVAWAESEHKELLYENLSQPLPKTFGDPDQVVRALMNLVGNALNYTPEGGRIVVRSQAYPLEQTNPEWVIIEVKDTGIGIPSSELSSIFDRFYRGSNVSPNIPGTGLGLAIIRDIVRLHGGSIDVESEEGRGSTFRLKLPVLDS